MSRNEEMWARTLSKKYGHGETGPMVFKHKQRACPIWRGIEWASTLLVKGIRWKAVDGLRICFGEDYWQDSRPLIDWCSPLLHEMDKDFAARDMWIE